MSAPITLRRDFGASQLRGLGEVKDEDGPQVRSGFWCSPQFMMS